MLNPLTKKKKEKKKKKVRDPRETKQSADAGKQGGVGELRRVGKSSRPALYDLSRKERILRGCVVLSAAYSTSAAQVIRVFGSWQEEQPGGSVGI